MAAVPPMKLISPEVVKLAKKDVHLPEIVQDATLKQLFLDFLEKEMMHENFLFWLDVEEYNKVLFSIRDITTKERRPEIFWLIFIFL
tara:strand:- start:105 stop:365 length:261 start_codon:yes stop_codon:yes gene_type:complete